MTLTSPTTTGALFYTLPFLMIAMHSLFRYLGDRENAGKKHIFYVFACFSISFALSFIAYALVTPDLIAEPASDPARHTAVIVLFKLFDIINMIGVFFLFIFLIDFIGKMKDYMPIVIAHLAITVFLIAVMPYSVNMINGDSYVRERALTASFAILFYWITYWGLIAYKFWQHTKLMEKKVPIRKVQLMCLGGVIAVMTYIFAISSSLFSSKLLVNLAVIGGMLSGIVFYLGFYTPGWLRKLLER